MPGMPTEIAPGITALWMLRSKPMRELIVQAVTEELAKIAQWREELARG